MNKKDTHRSGHPHQVHHARARRRQRRQVERDDPDSRGGLLHQGPRHRSRQDGQARRSQEGRLPPLLQAEHPDRRRRGQGQQPLRRRRHAAGARIRRDSRRALRLQLQRRRLPRTRPHRHGRHGRTRNPARPVPLARRTLGALPRGQGLHRRRRKRSPPRTTTTTAPARRRATTSSSPSTAPSRPSPAARTASCWSWPPAPARPTPRSRSSGGCGSPAPRSASSSSSTATSSPTRPRPTTSSRSARR